MWGQLLFLFTILPGQLRACHSPRPASCIALPREAVYTSGMAKKLSILIAAPKMDQMISLKLTTDALSVMQAKADLYADGNLSAWIRFAATTLDPFAKGKTNGKRRRSTR